MEILAPAGNFEAFFAALEKGADAIYVGIKTFNARAYARNFTLEELALMIPYAHQLGRKVFVALNSLIKETEWKDLIEIIIALGQIKPDAIIIQDLGVFWLCKHRFPHLVLHASTLMACHNVIGVKKLANMGFKRIVLARELTLKEIENIKKSVSVELEVFVHGALCFSYSGLCLASSYLGGQSSLRGRCRQPCRFLYQWGEEKGYYLSCNDLCALELIPILKEMRIDAIKIEGRMKSAEYVATVVEAYRLVRDASPDESQAAIDYAKSLLSKVESRPLTTGFFLTVKPKNVLDPKHPGAFGVYLGRVLRKEGERIFFRPEAELKAGDRIRAQNEIFGKGIAWKVKNLEKIGELICLNAPTMVEPGYLLFRVVSAIPGLKKSDKKLKTKLNQMVKPIDFKISSSSKKRLQQWIYAQGIEIPKKRFKRIIWWIRHEEVNYFLNYKLPEGSIPILSLNFQTYPLILAHFKKLLKKHPSLTISLPPIILPHQLAFFEKAIKQLLDLGFKRWQLANIGHFELFPEKKGLIFSSDYTFNVANHLALRTLKNMGIHFLMLSLELDKNTIKTLVKYWNKHEIVINVYMRMPVWISRLSLKPFWRSDSLISPLGEKYYPLKRDEITYILPEIPISLKDYLKELKSFGIYQFCVDLRFLLKKEVEKIVTSKGVFLPKGYQFNYQRGLA
ncbi:MAG TPA: U32 family peptidase [Candidatus Desulfofervidus auxilii]|uniref:U32 family peptidase n=1 Tax=Desulfofervidus auxilii TaxID=1621989 RepID=A0A7C0Y6X5_DESA2|nr:U32 family peptidase [Candidatus Desulfofervidus auxilii]